MSEQYPGPAGGPQQGWSQPRQHPTPGHPPPGHATPGPHATSGPHTTPGEHRTPGQPQTRPLSQQPPAPHWPALPSPPANRPPEHRGHRLLPVVVLSLVLGFGGGLAGGWLVTQDDETPAPAVDLGPVTGGRAGNSVVPVAQAVLPSVVSIEVRSTRAEVTGSGFVYDDAGHVVTNNHVIEPAAVAGEITVALSDDREVSATIVGRSPSYDIAVLKLDSDKGLQPVTLGSSTQVQVGQGVVAFGSPLGLSATVTSGIISATQRPVTAGGQGEISYINALQTDAAINPGNSGGPLVDLRGRVVGVNSAIATVGGQASQAGNIGVGFAIPIDQVRHTVAQIIETGQAEYPVIGAEVSVVTGLGGAKVQDVSGDSPAEKAGIQSGDLITQIEGTDVEDGIELIVKIRSFEPGDTVSMTVVHDGQPSKVEVTLGREVG